MLISPLDYFALEHVVCFLKVYIIYANLQWVYYF